MLKRNSTHLNQLDSLRALAAMYVCLHHAVLQIDPSIHNIIIGRIVFKLFAYGRYAVDLFIVISGFSLMLSFLKDKETFKYGIVGFYKKRFTRILPPYYIAMLLSLLFIALFIGNKTNTNWDISIPVTQFDILSHVSLIFNAFSYSAYKINHVFWSITLESQIYVLYPLIILSYKKFGTGVTTFLLTILVLVFAYLISKYSLNMNGLRPHYLLLFMFGILAAHAYYFGINYQRTLIAVLIAFSSIFFYKFFWDDLTVGLFSSVLLYLVATKKFAFINTVLGFNLLTFIGTFAYSIYLIHAPLLQLISQYVIQPFHISVLGTIAIFFILGLPIIVGIAYIFFLCAEKPFIRLHKVI